MSALAMPTPQQPERLPSIRELELTLEHLPAPATEAERTAVRVARALLRYVRNAGTPPQAPASPKMAAQTLALRSTGIPAHLLRPKARTLAGAVTETPPGRAGCPPLAARRQSWNTRGLTLKQIAGRTGYSQSHLANLLWAGVLPKPAIAAESNLPALWTRQQAEEIDTIMQDPERRKKPRAFEELVPEGWVSSRQFAARLGYANTSRIHTMVSEEKLPKPEFHRGRAVFWSEAVVAAIAATHRRGPPRQRTPKEPKA